MIRFIRRTLPILLLLAVIASCQSNVEQVDQLVANKFEDPEIIKIYELIDQRSSEGLLPYLSHRNEVYRFESALGFASTQDTLGIPKLSFTLSDSSTKVRQAAAYALGQIGDTSAIKPIIKALELENSVAVRQELLEALGKIVPQSQLSLLQYWPLKTKADKEGLAWGLYRAGIRNVHDGISVDLALSLLDSSNTYLTRLGAAHFLYRSRNLDLKGRTSLISKAATSDQSAHVRMAATLALRNALEQPSLDALKHITKDDDYRVRINAIRALGSFEFGDTKEIAFELLEDVHTHVGITAAQLIARLADESDIPKIKETLLMSQSGDIKAILWGVLIRVSDEKQTVIDQIKTVYEQTEDAYYKGQLLGALSQSLLPYEFIITKTFGEKHAATKTAGIQSLVNMRLKSEFPEELKPAFAEIFKDAITSGDVAMVAITSGLFLAESPDILADYDSLDFLDKARMQLKAPKDTEAIQMIDRVIAKANDQPYETPENPYNHPINWELVKSLGNEPQALIETSKGQVSLKLLVGKAPGSVANFVKLSKEGYYVDKAFHRVVPNFVIQGGCYRGDGYGSEDYSIRSEFANERYLEGTVGMASAGKDTEGTQWFITHSPTPHLDGGYTIFAQVIDGMDVVHDIKVGDKIQSITIQ